MKKVKIFPHRGKNLGLSCFVFLLALSAIILQLLNILRWFGFNSDNFSTSFTFWGFLAADLFFLVLSLYYCFESEIIIQGYRFNNDLYSWDNIKNERNFFVVALINKEFVRTVNDQEREENEFLVIKFDISTTDIYPVALQKNLIKHQIIAGDRYVKVVNEHMKGIYSVKELEKK